LGKTMKIFGTHDEQTIVQFQHVRENAVDAALMADGHVGYVMPIGGVAAYRDKVSVVGVGVDIACGNAAILTDLTLEGVTGIGVDEARANPYRVSSNAILNELANEVQDTVSFGIGRKNTANDAPVDDPLFMEPAWYIFPNTGGFRDELKEKARRQLGTVGSGNHYVDVFSDEQGRIWVGVHFGSRGLGFTIAQNFLAISQGGTWGDRAKEVEVLLDINQGAGYDYWHLMELAGMYAYAGREWVARKVVQILGGKEMDLVHNHHNFAFKETHVAPEGGTAGYVVVRKGATPAFPGQRGFVGGSMGDDSVILRGTIVDDSHDHEPITKLQREALYSTVHGAGRVMSRTEAAGKRKRKTGQVIKPGKISPEMMKDWLAKKGVILRGGGLDEAPQVYRRLPDVLKAQGDTVEVLHTLRPLIVVMAGANEFDPYKD
jgi:tRNA-splicing ligase RtcB